MKSRRRNIGIAAALGLIFVVAAEDSASAQRAAINLNIENSEVIAMESLMSENRELRETLVENRKSLAQSMANLVVAQEEGDVFRRLALELRLRIEALGVDAAHGVQKKLEGRLLSSVRDLKSLAEERKELSEALIRMTEAVSVYLGSSPLAIPKARLAIESELRNASSLLGGNRKAKSDSAAPASATKSDGIAIGVKDDLSLVVINLGLRNDISVGTPFDVFRGSKLVGAIRVVDVRENIAGAVIQDFASGESKLKVGDHIKAGFRN